VGVNPDPGYVTLSRNDSFDGFGCPKRRLIIFDHGRKYSRWLGWLIAFSSDAVLIVPIVALLGVGHFLASIPPSFFLMGVTLSIQLEMVIFRLYYMCDWKDEMFLGGVMCTSKSIGLMACVMEGPDNELFLTLTQLVLHDHCTRQKWLQSVTRIFHCCDSQSHLASSDQNV
jgi:hypothetical protein